MASDYEKQFLLGPHSGETSPPRSVFLENTVFSHRTRLIWGDAASTDPKWPGQQLSCFKWIWINIRDYALFGYFTPYMCRATYKGGHAVVPETLPVLKQRDNVNDWSSRFINAANQEWSRSKGPSRLALFRCLCRVFFKHFLAILLLKLIKIAFDILTTRSLKMFIASQEHLSDAQSRPSPRLHVTLLGFVVIFIQFSYVFACSQMDFWFSRVVMRLEGCLGTCLFRSTLIPMVVKKSNMDEGEVQTVKGLSSAYNLLTVDVPSIARSTLLCIDLLVLPVGIYFYFLELKYNVGDAAQAGLYGIGVVIAALLILELYNAYLKKPLLRFRDLRLHLLHNLIMNIQNLRLVHWERYAQQDVEQARKKELSVRRVRMYAHGISWALSDSSRYITQLIIFSTYVIFALRGRDTFRFSASVIMPTLQLMIRLMGPLTDISFLLHSLLEGAVSCFRYQAHVFGYTRRRRESLAFHRRLSDDSMASVDRHHYQDESDRCYAHQSLLPPHTPHPRKERLVAQDALALSAPSTIKMTSCNSCITIYQAIFSWNVHLHETTNFTVMIPQLQLERGECLILLGAPGSGKTSFIHALLGEMFCVQGLAKVRRNWQPIVSENGEVVYPLTPSEKAKSASGLGYAPQSLWIPEGTIRHAIVLGRVFDEERYSRVVKACELDYDFSQWPEGDQRYVFQNGHSLSTGQRSRIGLARALYDFPVFGEELNQMSSTHVDKHGYQGSSLFLLDNIFSSLDPSVGLLIYKNLIASGKNSLLRSAATVITMDEQNLAFFHKVLSEPKSSSHLLGVKIIFKTMRNGVLVDAQPDFSQLLATVQHPTTQDNTQDPSLVSRSKSPEFSKPVIQHETLVQYPSHSLEDAPPALKKKLNIEAPHQGGIGWSVYMFYFKKCGLFLTFLAICFTVLLTVQRMSCEIWLAHWSRMSRDAVAPPLTFSSPGPSSSPNTSLQDIHTRSNVSLINTTPPPPSPATLHLNETNDEDSLPSSNVESFIQHVSTPSGSTSAQQQPISYLRRVTFNSLIDITPRGFMHSLISILVKPVSTITALKLFIILSAGVIFNAFFVMLLTTYSGLCGAVKMHQDLLSGLLETSFWIYDSLTIGVIMNRFNSDIQVVDTAPGFQLNRLVMGLIHFMLVITILCIIRPSCLLLVPIVGWFVYCFIYKLYRPSSREFQRSLLLAWSPLTENISEAERGHVIIRALGAQTYYVKKNIHLTSQLLKVQFMQNGVSCWATTRFQLLASTFSIFNSVLPSMFALVGVNLLSNGLLQRFGSPFPFFQQAAYIGLAATYAMELPSCVRNIVTNTTYLDKCMCSVQRVKAMIELTQDATHKDELMYASSTVKEVSDMPLERTGLEIRHIVVAYRKPCEERKMRQLCSQTLPLDELKNQFFPPVISNFNAIIRPGEHIGIIGRTGAAKSSLLLCIAGFAPIVSGEICLDGIPNDKIHPRVREQLFAVLPPVPVVVKGWTVRQFLDPESIYPSCKLLEALNKVKMSSVIHLLPNGLDTVIIKDELNSSSDLLQSNHHIAESLTLDSIQLDSETDSHPTRWLSDSQLRILSIARLTLSSKTYRVLLMDEPPVTSLEARQEQIVSKNHSVMAPDTEIGLLLRQLFPDMIVIIAAHYASTIRHCDRVWVMSKGEVKREILGSDLISQESLSHFINTSLTEL